MENHQTYSELGVHVESILEVRICREMWERIKWVAERRECTYSWVVRYAVFRLIRRVDPKKYMRVIGNPRLRFDIKEAANVRAWERRSGASLSGVGGKHRHRLCLYGEDELAIRHTAMYYRCTMTHLIRVALELHFERLYASLLKTSFDLRALRPGYGAALRGPLGGRAARARVDSHGMSYFQRAFWYWLGIKVYDDVEFHFIALEKKMTLFRRFYSLDYFGKKHPTIKTEVGKKH